MTNTPETPDSNPFLRPMSEAEITAEIGRQMAAFRRAHNLPDAMLGAPPAADARAMAPEPEVAEPETGAEDAGAWDAGTGEPSALYSTDFSDLLADDAHEAPTELIRQLRIAAPAQAAARGPRYASRLALAGVAALLLAAGAVATLWHLQAGARSSLPVFLIANVTEPDEPVQSSAPPPQREIYEPRLARAPGAALGLAAVVRSAAPPIVATLKPAVPAGASSKQAKPAASYQAAASSGPFEPLFDFLSPLTRQLSLAGQAIGGDSQSAAGAVNRDQWTGNGGNK